MGSTPETRPSLLIRVRDPADQAAWQEFVEIYQPVILRLARRKGMQAADADDVAQEILVAVARAVEQREHDPKRAKFRTWLGRVAHNAILNALTRGRPDRGSGDPALLTVLDQRESLPEGYSVNNSRITCDPLLIELFLAQKLSDLEQAAFRLHLDDCDDCRRQLEAAAAGAQIWAELRDSLRGQQPPADSLSGGDTALDSAAGGEASFGHATVLKLLAPTDDDRMLGRLGTYEVVGVIGSGGMGVVLKAFDAALNRYVAIKVLAPHLGSSGAARKRFLAKRKPPPRWFMIT